jgi:hypothetical protein
VVFFVGEVVLLKVAQPRDHLAAALASRRTSRRAQLPRSGWAGRACRKPRCTAETERLRRADVVCCVVCRAIPFSPTLTPSLTPV